MIDPFKKRKANDKFERTSNLINRIEPAGHNLFLKVLPFSKVPKNKLILPEGFKGDFASNGRAVILKKGPECKRDYLEVGDEVYFGTMVSSTINYPNPNEGDDQCVMLSEQNVIYYTKSIKKD